jgi:hypothetical protein
MPINKSVFQTKLARNLIIRKALLDGIHTD